MIVSKKKKKCIYICSLTGNMFLYTTSYYTLSDRSTETDEGSSHQHQPKKNVKRRGVKHIKYENMRQRIKKFSTHQTPDPDEGMYAAVLFVDPVLYWTSSYESYTFFVLSTVMDTKRPGPNHTLSSS